MSKDSSPGRNTFGFFDSYYDPEFTAQISSKMFVPDKISVYEGADKIQKPPQQTEDVRSSMQVPERILVAGDNKHLAAREPLPDITSDSPYYDKFPTYSITPPPNVLTVDAYPYPTVELNPVSKRDLRNKPREQVVNENNEGNESMLNTSITPEEELMMLRRQVRHLSRRMLAIEQENQQRQQREIILYSVGVIYFIFKGLIWLQRHF